MKDAEKEKYVNRIRWIRLRKKEKLNNKLFHTDQNNFFFNYLKVKRRQVIIKNNVGQRTNLKSLTQHLETVTAKGDKIDQVDFHLRKVASHMLKTDNQPKTQQPTPVIYPASIREADNITYYNNVA